MDHHNLMTSNPSQARDDLSAADQVAAGWPTELDSAGTCTSRSWNTLTRRWQHKSTLLNIDINVLSSNNQLMSIWEHSTMLPRQLSKGPAHSKQCRLTLVHWLEKTGRGVCVCGHMLQLQKRMRGILIESRLTLNNHKWSRWGSLHKNGGTSQKI